MTPRPTLLVVLVLTAISCAYINALSAPFIWDDRTLILEQAKEKDRSLAFIVTQPFWWKNETGMPTPRYFRPLTALSYATDFRLHGENATGFHLTNIALHLANVALLLFLARRLGASPFASALAGLAFGLAPRLTQSVTWISGRTDVLAATFTLGALLLWPWRLAPDARDVARGTLRRWASALGLALGFMAKEVALAGLVAIAAFEFHRARRVTGERGASLDAAKALLPCGVLVAAAVAAREIALRGVVAAEGGPPLEARLLAAVEAWGRYAWMVVDALRPQTQIGLLGAPSVPFIVVGAAVVVLVSLATVRLWRRGTSEELVGPLLALSALLPVVQLSYVVVAADRLLYLPLAGLALGAAVSAGRLREAAPRRDLTRGAALATLVFACASGVFTWLRNEVWSDDLRFWIDAARTTDRRNPLPEGELGNVLYRGGAFDDARLVYLRALAAEPPLFRNEFHRIGSGNLANALVQTGRYDEARAIRQRLLEENPGAPSSYFDLALIDAHRLDFAASRETLRHALDLSPSYADARSLLATLNEVEPQWRAIVDAPSSPELLARRAGLEARLGRREEAAGAYLRLLETPHVSPEDRAGAAAYLVRRGDLPSAVRALESVSREGPKELLPALAAEVEERRHFDAQVAASRPLP